MEEKREQGGNIDEILQRINNQNSVDETIKMISKEEKEKEKGEEVKIKPFPSNSRFQPDVDKLIDDMNIINKFLSNTNERLSNIDVNSINSSELAEMLQKLEEYEKLTKVGKSLSKNLAITKATVKSLIENTKEDER